MENGVVLYLRVSTEDQDLAGQKAELLAYAAARGWTVVGTYEEKTSASGRVAREQFEKLLKDAKVPDRGWRRVLVWALDRWSRDPSFVKAVGSIEQLEALGVLFHSFKEPWIDSSSTGEVSFSRDLMRAVLPTLAAFEARRRSERTHLAMNEIKSGKRRTRTGRPPGRPRKVTPEIQELIVRLRNATPRPKWREIAVRLRLPAGTCKKAYSTLRRQSASVVNGPGGFVAATSAPREVPGRAR
jgi:DNA invertase Pin-like site-specific DNA recombinase